jgi:hypothetical protein
LVSTTSTCWQCHMMPCMHSSSIPAFTLINHGTYYIAVVRPV